MSARRVRLRAPDVPELAGVERGSRDGDRHELWTADSDALVRQLVTSGVPFRDLEVATASLEEAFLALVGRRRKTKGDLAIAKAGQHIRAELVPRGNELFLENIWPDDAATRRAASLLTTADDLEACARLWRKGDLL